MKYKIEITFEINGAENNTVHVVADKDTPLLCIEELEDLVKLYKANLLKKIDAHIESIGGVEEEQLDAVITKYTNNITFADLV